LPPTWIVDCGGIITTNGKIEELLEKDRLSITRGKNPELNISSACPNLESRIDTFFEIFLTGDFRAIPRRISRG
jgi:hypothetical protein